MKPKNNSEKVEEQKLRDLHLQMGKSLIENDEKNQKFTLANKIGRFLMRPVSFWRRFRAGF